MKKLFLILFVAVLLTGCNGFVTPQSIQPINGNPLTMENNNENSALSYPYADGELGDDHRLTSDRTIGRIFGELIYATKQHIDLCNDVPGPNEEFYISPEGKKEISSTYREYIAYVDYNYFRVDLYPYRASECDLYVYEVLTSVKNGKTTVRIMYDGNNVPKGITTPGEKTYSIEITD